MILNSLSALALGFLLDMTLGSCKGRFSPRALVKKLIAKLTEFLKGAYAETPAAQRAAGGVLVFITLFITLSLSILLLLVAYKIGVVLGIIAEGILCWFSLSIRDMRISATGIFRAVKNDNFETAQKRLDKLAGKPSPQEDYDGIICRTVEILSNNACDKVAAPIFYITIFGGVGGIFYRVISLLDECVGVKNDRFRYFGKFAAKLDDLITFIPARICAKLLMLDTAFLKLNRKNAKKSCRKYKNKTSSPNKGRMQSVCAGALGISLYSAEYIDGEPVSKEPIGDALKYPDYMDIYWMNQLYCGTAALCVILAAVVRAAVFFIF